MSRRVLEGAAAAPGQAVGTAHPLAQPAAPAARAQIPDHEREGEAGRAFAALDVAATQITELAARLRGEAREEEARLAETGALMAEDPELRAAVGEAIAERGLDAASAIRAAAERFAVTIAALPDPTLAARADDVRSLARRAALAAGEVAESRDVPTDAILVARELGPVDVLELKLDVRGVALAAGGATAHAAIVARSLGIPMAVGLGEQILDTPPGTQVLLDGTRGMCVLEPAPDEVSASREEARSRERARARALASRHLPSVTADGRRIKVLCNACGSAELAAGIEAGAEGLGLLRAELAFLDAPEWPTEAEHTALIEPLLAPLAPGTTATVRLLDLGGDKRAPFLGEDGRRGIELLLDRPEALNAQVRAVVASTSEADLRLLIPMVRGVEDVRAVRAALERAVAAVPGSVQPALGAMIETREAALKAAEIAAEVDFLSIGTNDLTASVLGADRERTTTIAAHEPELVRLLAHVARAGARMRIAVEVCGEMASEKAMVPLLIGLGVDELSVGAARVGAVREWVRALDYWDAVMLTRRALGATSAADVAATISPLVRRLELLDKPGDAGLERANGSSGVVAFGM